MNTDPERYDRVAAHPDYPGTLAYEPRVPDAGFVLGIVEALFPSLTITFVGLALAITIATLVVMGAPVWLMVILAVVVGALLMWTRPDGLAAMIRGRARAFEAAPIERHIMVVVHERTHVWGDRAHTDYYATLHARDGTRTEYHTSGTVAGKLAIGDIGVAFVKSRTLLDFARFDV